MYSVFTMEHALIQRFLSNKCTAAEAAIVSAYLQEHPEVLRQYLSEEEWDATLPAELSPALSEQMLQHIEEHIQPVKRIYPITRIAAAAAVLIAVSLLTAWLISDRQRAAHQVAKVSATAAPHWVTKENNTGKTVELLLPDESKITLTANSTISYKEPFSREVHLQGKATFSVQASPEKPFIVYGGNVTTTALGTVFTVVAYKDDRHTNVTLSQGKVLITPVNGGMAIALKPGEELTYDNRLLTSSVTSKAKSEQMMAARPAGVVNMPDTIFFYDAPLPDIVRALGNISDKHIRLEKRGIPSISFTGQFDKRKDNAVSTLQTIAGLNNLKVTETDSEIVISK
jgi:transmembrane sensor